jgi:hypothetical protein
MYLRLNCYEACKQAPILAAGITSSKRKLPKELGREKFVPDSFERLN